MRFRKLRIAWSIILGVACMLLIVLWVRSYWWMDYTDRNSPINICSMKGKLLIGKTLELVSENRPNPPFPTTNDHFGFDALPLRDWQFTFADNGLSIPYWLCTLLLAPTAILHWFRWRFTLRTLLVATTLIAVVLGLLVYAASD